MPITIAELEAMVAAGASAQVLLLAIKPLIAEAHAVIARDAELRARRREQSHKRVTRYRALRNALPTEQRLSKKERKKEATLSTSDLNSRTLDRNNARAHEFERAWSIYPKRKGDNAKGRARKAWAAAIKRIEPERLIAAIKAYASSGADCIGTEYQPMLSTWLNGESYESFLPREAIKRDKDWMLKLNGGQDATTQETAVRPDTRVGQNGSTNAAQLRSASRMDDVADGRANPVHPVAASDRRG